MKLEFGAENFASEEMELVVPEMTIESVRSRCDVERSVLTRGNDFWEHGDDERRNGRVSFHSAGRCGRAITSCPK